MARSYVPQLIKLIVRLNVYVVKHQSTIAGYLTGTQLTAWNAFIPCLNALVTALGPYVEGP